jgi:hypothetical protein
LECAPSTSFGELVELTVDGDLERLPNEVVWAKG